MHLTFCGAARGVTGSCFLLEAAGRRVLIDCGLFQGDRAARARNWSQPLFAPGEIDAVLLTHAHIDHSGLLPRLVRQGFKGRVVATEATADLCGIMLPDSAHIQEMEAEWRGRKGKRAGRQPEEPLYTAADAEAALPLFHTVKYNEEIEVVPGVHTRFLDAGHILGSAIIEVRIEEEGRETKIVFSGDLGQRGAPIIRDPGTVEEADYLLVESTYGDRLHEDAAGRRQKLSEVILAAQRSGGNLIIPAFAVERTQELLYELKSLVRTGAIVEPRVYIDSPMAVSATEIFLRHPECFDAETWAKLKSGDSPLEFPGLTFVRTIEESRALNGVKGGAVIISASGMCDAGRILHHLKHNLWRPEAHLLFVGYQAEGTLGRRLLDGEKNVRIMGEEIAVRVTVHNIASFSAHADRRGLLDWLGALRARPRALFLVHGEDEVLARWSDIVRRATGMLPAVPAYGETYDLAATARLVRGAARAEPQDEWSRLLGEVDAAYRGMQARLPARRPEDPRVSARLGRFLRRVIEEMAEVS